MYTIDGKEMSRNPLIQSNCSHSFLFYLCKNFPNFPIETAHNSFCSLFDIGLSEERFKLNNVSYLRQLRFFKLEKYLNANQKQNSCAHRLTDY